MCYHYLGDNMENLYSIGEGFTENPSNERFQLHFHDDYEIFMFLEGDSKYVVEENTHSLKPDDIIVIRKHQMHRIYHNSPVRYHRIILNIHPNFFKEENCEKYEEHFIYPENYIGNKIDAETVHISGLYDAMMRLKKYSEDFTDRNSPIVRSTIVEILYLISNIKSYSKDEAANPQLQAIIQYISQNFTKPLTLEMLEKKFFISKYHLCHIFLKATGITVHQYITNKRFTYANELIKSGKNITEAASEAGFNNYSSFYRAYKNQFGSSPNKKLFANQPAVY